MIRPRWQRPLAIVALCSVVVAPVAVDRVVGRQPTIPSRLARAVNPSVTSELSGASTWFCASGRTTTDGLADLTVTIANPTGGEVPGRVTWFSGDVGRQPIVQPVLSAAASRTDVNAPREIAGGPIAALIEFDGGGIAVEHRISGPHGGASALCASSANARWISADGATTIDAKTTLSIFNPFPEDALLDVRFVTDRGTALPAALQGVSVAARTVFDLNVGDYVRRRTRVAAIVRARIGRVVMERTTIFDGSGTAKGTTISPATSTTSPTWYFAAGRKTSVLRERYSLFNPTRSTATAIIDVLIDGVAGVEPFEIDVPPLGTAELIPNAESRIPRDVGYSVVVSTDDGTGIVVERTVDARGRVRSGYASSPGIVAPAERWVIPDAAASATRTDVVSILNPTDTDAAIAFESIGADGRRLIDSASNVLVPASGRLDVRLGDYVALNAESLVISSPGAPVVIERTMQRIDRIGARPLVDPLPAPGRDDSLRALTVETLPVTASSSTIALAPTSAPVSSAAPPTSASSSLPSSSAPAIPAALALVSSENTSTTTSPTTRGVVPVASTTAPSAPSAPASLVATTAASSTIQRITVASSTTGTTSPSTTVPASPSTTSAVSPSTTTTLGLPTDTRARAVTPRVGRAALGTSVTGALPLP